MAPYRVPFIVRIPLRVLSRLIEEATVTSEKRRWGEPNGLGVR